MDGFEFTLALKKDKELKNVPIIVITSRIIEHKKRAAELKLPYLVEKPYQEYELLGIIQKILGAEK
jgi:chemosensory pili system protein ChpA (sensor histidine kinase/response regulator)